MSTELKYSVATAVGVCIWKLAEHFLGFNSTHMEIGQYTRIFFLILPVVMIVLGIREKRDFDYGGTLDFYDGLRTGVMISAVSAAFAAVFFSVYQYYINPEYLNHLIGFEKSRMIGDGIPAAAIDAKIDAMRTMNSFPILPIFHFVGLAVSGLFVSIIASAVLKRHSTPPSHSSREIKEDGTVSIRD